MILIFVETGQTVVSGFENAFSVLHKTVEQTKGVAVTYHRGASNVSLTAVPGSTKIEEFTESGVTSHAKVRDWKISVADLVLNSVAVEPQRDDLIKRTMGSKVYTFEVLPISGNGGKVFEYTDSGQEKFRIHTKLSSIDDV